MKQAVHEINRRIGAYRRIKKNRRLNETTVKPELRLATIELKALKQIAGTMHSSLFAKTYDLQIRQALGRFDKALTLRKE